MAEYNPIPPQFRTPADDQPSREKKWLDKVEEQVTEAQERGDFDNLRGKGKPLDLRGNPHAGDWEMAYKAMANAGYVPDWIERDQEIRKLLDEAQRMLDRHVAWHNEQVEALPSLAEKERAARQQVMEHAQATLISRYEKQAVQINRKILDFNLVCPVPSLHRFQLRIPHEIRDFEARLAPLP